MTNNSGAKVNKNLVLTIATICAFTLPFVIGSINIALPRMGRDFNMDAVVMSWVSTAYFLAVAIVQVPFGRLSDIFGRRRLFVLGLTVSTLASFLGAFAVSVPMLIISRAFQGFGFGIAFNNSVAILTSIFPPAERAKALGISQAGTYLGLSLSPLIGGFMTEHLGWPSIFLLAGCLGIFLTILVFRGLKTEWREAKGESFDITGCIVYSIGIALFMYGFSSLPDFTGIILFIIGAACLGFFAWWEIRTPTPVFKLDIFRNNPVFLLSNLATLVIYISTFAVNFLLSLYLQYLKDLTAQTAGLVLVTSSVMMTIFTLLSGYISRKIEPRLVATLGMAADCVATIMLIYLGSNTPMWYIILALGVYGMGIGLFVAPNTNIIMSSVEVKILGVASGILGTMRTGGMMLSMGITMILFSLYMGQAEITEAYYPQFMESVRMGFIIFSILGVAGVIAQMVARRPRKEAVAQ